jgi:hypothetical protein
MSKPIIILISVLLLPFANTSQCVTAQQFDTNPIASANNWLIQGTHVLRINDEGETLGSYSNRLLGIPTSIDPSDPFRVIVFYSSHQQISIINTDGVAIGKPIMLTDLGLGEVTLACRSSQGGVWLYHREGNELVLTNSQFTRIVQRISLSNSNNDGVFNHLEESENIMYLGVNNDYIATFDSYGSNLETIPLPYNNFFRVIGDNIWTLQIGFLEKRTIHNPSVIVERYKHSCKLLPLIINGEPMCYSEKGLTHYEKFTP